MLSDLHNHSTFSDGINTCEELIKQAISLGLKRIGLVDHVRRNNEWVSDFIDCANRLKEKYEGIIQIVTGLEAKVLTCTGELDFNDKWSDRVNYIFGAIHRIPSRLNQFYNADDKALDKEKVYEDWLSTMEEMLKNEMVDIIAHPAAELIHYKILLNNQDIVKLCDFGKRFGKIFEINIKHNVPAEEFLTYLIKKEIPLSIGSDSHSIIEQQFFIKDIIAIHKKMASCILI